jgi:glucose 1-dehydrogenase
MNSESSSMKAFSNHVAIITGAGQGIGFAIASALCAEGAAVVLNDVDADLAIRSAGFLKDRGGKCIAVPGDSGDMEIISRLVETAVKEFGKVTLCIANAGVTVFSRFLDFKEPDFHRIVDTNLKGSFFLAQAFAYQVVKQQSGGSILFMSSVTGRQAHQNLSAYGMTKAALEMLAKHLVSELSQHNIRVNAIAPGATLTERTQSDLAYQRTWSNITPLGKPASVQDIAHAALFLLSNKANHITGQTLIVDGGWTVVSPQP